MTRMILDEFQSRLNELFRFDEKEDGALAEYLQILKPVPVPRLANARRHVLAEAARSKPSHAYWSQLFLGLAPRWSLTWAVALFLLLGGMTTASLASNPGGAANFFFGLSSTPTVAMTRAPLKEASATVSLAPTPLNAPVPLQNEMTITPAPAPTPAPTLPLMRTVQSQPTN